MAIKMYDILHDIKNYIKYKRIWLSGKRMTRQGREFQEVAQIGVGSIFTIYGFLALTNPDSFPIFHIRFDPLIGFILFLIGVYIVFFKNITWRFK